MSTLIVEISRIEKVFEHPNADALELAHIKGWQCVIPKGKFSPGDLVTYVPVDSVLPVELSDRVGITKYLSNGRVRCARLRGEPSFGVILDRENPAWEEGRDVADYYGITKYEPPVRISMEDAETPHPLLQRYTDIENLRNFPDVLREGEEVVVTEKIHGTNCKVGIIEGVPMAGSMEVQRKRPEDLSGSIYWKPFTLPSVEALLQHLAADHRQVVLYGEVYGSKIQTLHYGMKGQLGYATFDCLVDGKFLDYDRFVELCARFEVPTVPVLYRGPYSLEKIRQLAEGPTTLDDQHIREGVVVKPAIERTDPKVGRVCLKYLGDGYLFSKGVSDSRDV